MTPLEEIEQAISWIKSDKEASRDSKIAALAPLYTARAIERLEATVRAIGVLMQHEADEKRDRGPAQFVFDPIRIFPARHDFTPGVDGILCRFCGRPAVGPEHNQ